MKEAQNRIKYFIVWWIGIEKNLNVLLCLVPRCQVLWFGSNEYRKHKGCSGSHVSVYLLIHALNANVILTSSLTLRRCGNWATGGKDIRHLSCRVTHILVAVTRTEPDRTLSPPHSTHTKPQVWWSGHWKKPGSQLHRCTALPAKPLNTNKPKALDGRSINCCSQRWWKRRSEIDGTEWNGWERGGGGGGLAVMAGRGPRAGMAVTDARLVSAGLARAGRLGEGEQRGERGDPVPMCILPRPGPL